jgi:4'-phosphopantetheinyl transferase
VELPRGQVHCWSVRLEVPPGRTASLATRLSADEVARCERLRSPTLRRRFIAGRAALRGLLARYIGTTPEEVGFVRNAYGKPFLEGGQRERLEFNLSHSGDLALIAVALNTELGVDLERVEDSPELSQVARDCFGPSGGNAPEDPLPGHQTRDFFRRWVRAEAAGKALGIGLEALTHSPDLGGWSTYPLEPAPGYVGALVVRNSGWHVIERSATLEEADTLNEGSVTVCC